MLQIDPKRSLTLLRNMHYFPDYIVRGSVNGILVDYFLKMTKTHRQIYTNEYPTAFYLEYFDPHIPPNCSADFRNCGEGVGHTCVPGPLNDASEDFVQQILSPVEAFCDPPDCICHMDDEVGLILSCHRGNDTRKR